MIIRLVRIDDAAGVSGLLETLGYRSPISAVEARIARYLASPDSIVFVAALELRLVGLASFHRIPLFHADGALGRITSFVVDSSHRKTGIGRSLIAAVEEFAWKHDCVRMEVTSGDHRADAHAFYLRVGYEFDCRRFIKQKRSSV